MGHLTAGTHLPGGGGEARPLPAGSTASAPWLARSLGSLRLPTAPLFQAAPKSFLHTRYFCTALLSPSSPPSFPASHLLPARLHLGRALGKPGAQPPAPTGPSREGLVSGTPQSGREGRTGQTSGRAAGPFARALSHTRSPGLRPPAGGHSRSAEAGAGGAGSHFPEPPFPSTEGPAG